MPRITLELLRKRSEHNEGIVSTLEEISLHQEEIEKIEVIGTLCRKLRILYLQNNIIEKIEDLTHMKDLRYLNLALNNIKKIEGLGSCEFLEKLDLTVNFIDVDELEESINHLKPRVHLKELFMLGNPAQADWDNFSHYVIASLPQLQQLDGKDITKSDRIKALQKLPVFNRELAALIAAKRHRDAVDVIPVVSGKATDISHDDGATRDTNQDEKLPYTPQTRRHMYMELAEQKEEEEARKRSNLPRDRDYEREHHDALATARHVEAEGAIRQCNEGKWEFRMDDETKPGFVLVEVGVPKFLDSSLIHVDMHPTYVTIVIKNKVLRLRFPEEVKCDQGTALRSKTTGALQLTVEKVDPSSVQRAQRARARRQDDADVKTNQATHDARPRTIQDQVAVDSTCLSNAQRCGVAAQIRRGVGTRACGAAHRCR
ncbi:hypothetical protein, variant 3 [Aphanomyces invadans]|uniref:Dynein axonemal assembly factor 11-like CS domain-containing protein n=1 Tax=Aphanomyces invadans TaxID=157072 RepID=A0A024TLU9_9STRA|nr:hypothetical protein, variant 2 [Aphanomyces invadans]XP_008876534.1 hypothetical protein, variant 3 [Aphanomyces invadans]ETV94944.1 hypothetical protein, variant 2 [Aphanomyces invadans]ETV94945.1 hypothetical protein, variant 3 [Aphanomyces invadans]|eukprot:XP_008876533.1 hypothetical protein, variant 2 [Aphanomyces invadans]